MTLTEIHELIRFVAKSGVDEVNIEKDGFKLGIKKSPVVNTITLPAPTVQKPLITHVEKNSTQPEVIKEILQEPDKPSTTTVTIKSPMIGTFYRSSSPDAPAFINVGDVIKKGKVVCVIEAMKLFNEIESEFSGKIVKVLIENASPVEYDQPLFLIDTTV